MTKINIVFPEPDWYFPMDDLSGSELYSDITGTVYNSDNHIPGIKGNAMEFHGTNSYIDFTNVPKLSELCLSNMNICVNGMTISLWVNYKPKQYIRNKSVWYSRERTDDASMFIIYRHGGNDRLEVKFKTKSFNQVTLYSESSLSNYQWYHVAVTYEHEEYVRLYIDGCLQTTAGFTAQDPPSTGDSYTLSIAGSLYESAPYLHKFAECFVDEIMVWSQYQDAAFIWQLYAYGVFDTDN